MTTEKDCLPSTLSTELEVLRLSLKDQSLTLDELKQALAHRGWAMLLVILSLPIPFSNSLPAWAVVLLAVGMLEKDGLCVLLGHLTAVATWIFIGLTSVFAIEGFRTLLDSAWLTE
jgi:hypothetical protein